MRDIAYLKLLAREYPTIQSASKLFRYYPGKDQGDLWLRDP